MIFFIKQGAVHRGQIMRSHAEQVIAASRPTQRGIDRGMYRSGNGTYSQPRYNLRLMLLAVVYLIVEMILRRISTVH